MSKILGFLGILGFLSYLIYSVATKGWEWALYTGFILLVVALTFIGFNQPKKR